MPAYLRLGQSRGVVRRGSYLATAARHSISALDALTRAFHVNPWIPETG